MSSFNNLEVCLRVRGSSHNVKRSRKAFLTYACGSATSTRDKTLNCQLKKITGFTSFTNEVIKGYSLAAIRCFTAHFSHEVEAIKGAIFV